MVAAGAACAAVSVRRRPAEAVLVELWVRGLVLRGLGRAEAVSAVREYLSTGPLDDEDVWHLDRMSQVGRRSYLSARWPGGGMLVAAMLYVAPPGG